MDPNGRIYRDLEEKIPAEDKARLEGYLIARAEVDTEARLKAQAEKLERELAAARKITRDPNAPRKNR